MSPGNKDKTVFASRVVNKAQLQKISANCSQNSPLAELKSHLTPR